MKMDNSEMMKLFDFILGNKSIIIAENGLFSRDTLLMIRAIVKGKVPNDFQLTKSQKELIITSFINSNNIFNEDTPSFIIENEECMKLAIKRDANSAHFIKNATPDLQAYIINEVLKQDFVLKENSPDFLKANYDVALNSIKVDITSADFIKYESIKDEELDNLINEIIHNNYILTNQSNRFLKSNVKIILESYKKDKETIEYATGYVKEHPEVFKYLLLNGYPYRRSYLRDKTLNHMLDKDVLRRCLKRLDMYGQDNEEYISRVNKLFSDAIKSYPSLHTFESIFQSIAETEWRKHKNYNRDHYENIFGKICSELRNYDNFDHSLNELYFLKDMKLVLANKYNDIYNAMKEYFNIFHSDTTKKIEKMQPYQDIIVKLSALYVSKCKENFKKAELKKYYEWVKTYFILRRDHPIVHQKIIQKQKKEIFRDLYYEGDEDVCNFLNDIVQSYSKYASTRRIWNMINAFVIDGRSKIEDLYSAPLNYDDYKRYEKVLKLINRLNSGYIQYDGIEVNNYRNIIKYDEKTKKYIYAGMSFNADDIKAYDEFNKKSKLFEQIKKDISIKVRTMEIDDEIDANIFDEISKEAPFTDEYFEFNEEWIHCFTLGDLCRLCMRESYGFKMKNFTDNESFTNLYNLLIDNGIIWLLLFMDRDPNQTLKENGINSHDIKELINNMKNISDLSKKFTFDTKKYDELLILNNISECADVEAIAILGQENIEKLYMADDYTSDDAEQIVSVAKDLACQMVKKNKSTIPFVNGETMNYKYSVYDSQDASVLLAGINTDSCFRISGTDHDFLHYCVLDKNGLVMKITDSLGNFIARASGFRNGNCVFFNQLRTIYDISRNKYNGDFGNEKDDIIETFKKACEDIVNTSHQNPYEVDKIENVFVTQSYILKHYESNVSDDVTHTIGNSPMDHDSEDWIAFINSTENLKACEKSFVTDYGHYPLICMASSKRSDNLKPNDIKPKNVEAVYERPRNRIIGTVNPDTSIFKKINKINGIKSSLDNKECELVSIPEEATVFTGDNWYIIFQNNNIISSCVLDFDKKAQAEFEVTKNQLTQYILPNNQQLINIDQIIEAVRTENYAGYGKTLKMNH